MKIKSAITLRTHVRGLWLAETPSGEVSECKICYTQSVTLSEVTEMEWKEP